jgi:hypothetical protein
MLQGFEERCWLLARSILALHIDSRWAGGIAGSDSRSACLFLGSLGRLQEINE